MSKDDFKEKACWVYSSGEAAISYQELLKGISQTNMEDKEVNLMKLLKSIICDDNYPSNLMIKVINSLLIVEDQRIKKLLFLFWEIIEKRNQDGGIKEEFYLVCNNLRKDLSHPNEYVRGRTIRLLSKLPHKEILESLVPVLIENLTHKHPYVRRNALMCIVSIVRSVGSDYFSNKINTRLIEIIEKDSDLSSKRNAYLALSTLDIEASVKITVDLINSPDINDLGDIFAISLIQNVKKLCEIRPKDKSKFLKLLVILSKHKSNSVQYEVANTITQLTSNSNVIRVAINLFTNLLVEQSENNIRIVILKKLMELKVRYRDIFEEQVLYFARILNSNCTNELRKLLFNMIGELVTESNINSVIEILISDFNKMKSLKQSDEVVEYKNLVLLSICKYVKKFKNTKDEYLIFLLEKCLLYDSNQSFLEDQIIIIKELFLFYGERLQKQFVERILVNFEDISIPEILQTSIWILSEIVNDLNTLKQVFDLIMKNIGDLNLELSSEQNKADKEKSTNSNEKKVITKTVVLSDGTYGTSTILVDAAEVAKSKDTKFLRTFLLEKNFFFATTLAVSLTKIIFKINSLDKERDIYNAYIFNTISIIIAILKIDSHKIYKDPDNLARIQLCLEFIVEDKYEAFIEYIRESQELFKEFYSKQNEANQNKNSDKIIKKNLDDYISFRHVRPFDSENADLVEEDEGEDIVIKHKNSPQENTQLKFTEVLTGSEDIIHLEASVQIFSFDIIIEFLVVNKSNNILQNISIELFAPTNLEIIEKTPQISLNAGASKVVRSCIKFTSTSNSYIFGQLTFNNHRGLPNSLNLSGIFIDLMQNTYKADYSESAFRKNWVGLNWEHKVVLMSKMTSFKELIDFISQKLNLKYIGDYESIDEESIFLVANLFTKSKLGEDALINISIEKTADSRIIGNSIIRSNVQDFAQFIGEKVKSIII